MSFDQTGNVITEGNAFHPGPAGRITDEVLDIETLKALEKVKAGNGSDFLVQLIDLYLQSTPQRILAIRNAAADKEWMLLKHAAHTLKGSSGTLGLRQVAKVCQQLEEANSPGCSDSIEALVQLLESRFFKAQQALAAECLKRL
jgi:HPt (histidine-containing phosphotransfer) domain-containing protein